MKKIFVLLVIVTLLFSCEKYELPTSLSLSGEYRIDMITYQNNDGVQSSTDLVFNPGNLYVNPNESFPMDSIEVGFTRLHLDYSVISFLPKLNSAGGKTWTKNYFYDVYGSTKQELGYIEFNCNGTKRVWKIINDGAESLVLATTGQWSNGSSGSNATTTLVLTRVGP